MIKYKSIRITGITESADTITINATEIPPKTIRCVQCGADKYQLYGTRQRQYKDMPHKGKPVTIMLTRQRYRCKQCKRTFDAPAPDLHPAHRCTNRLYEYIIASATDQTNTSIAQAVGMQEFTIRYMLKNNKP